MAAEQWLEGVDILINNVGIQPPTSYKNVEETPEDIWDAILNVNLKIQI